MSNYAQQFLRTLTLLSWFRAHPEGSLLDASADLGVGVAQLRHELSQVQMCGLPGLLPGSCIEVDVAHLHVHVRDTLGLDGPIRLTAQEASVLVLSLRALRTTLPPERIPALESAQITITGLLRAARQLEDERLRGIGPNPGDEDLRRRALSEGAEHPEAESAQAPAAASDPAAPQRRGAVPPNGELASVDAHPGHGSSETFDALQVAVRQRRLVRFDYHALSTDSTGQRVVRPDIVVVTDRGAYLRGRNDAGQERNYALSRIRNLSADEPGSAGPACASPVDPYDPFSFGDANEWAPLTLTPHGAWLLEYFPFFHDEPEPAGTDQGNSPAHPQSSDAPRAGVDPAATRALSAYLPDTGEWLERFVIEHNGYLAEVGSEDLSQRVHRRCQAALKVYADRQARVE